MTDGWVDFYEPVLGISAATRLVKRCQAGPPGNTAKLIMHQARRLVSLADDITTIRPGRESLQVMFVMICAEHVAKLADGVSEDGKSRHYTRDFFDRFMSPDDRDLLDGAFTDLDTLSIGWKRAVDALYDVRCDVVHEGNYWDFTFRDGDVEMLNVEYSVIARISFRDFRDLVVRCSARAAELAIDWPEAS